MRFRDTNEPARPRLGGRAEPCQGDGNQTTGGVLRWQSACGGQSVEAEAGEFLRGDVIPEPLRGSHLDEKTAEQIDELLLSVVDPFSSMQQRRELLRAVTSTVVADECVLLEHSPQSLIRIAGALSQLTEAMQMIVDMALMPSDQDGFDVREVLVQGRATDAAALRDLGHGHRQQPLLGHQVPRRAQDRLANGVAVRLDRVRPEPRHCRRVRRD